jgi:hypothetical protein
VYPNRTFACDMRENYKFFDEKVSEICMMYAKRRNAIQITCR